MTWLGDELDRIADGMPQRDLTGHVIEVYHRRRRNVIALAAAALVVVVVLGGTAAIQLKPETARPVAPPERAVIDVGVADTVEAAPLYVALSKGYFAAEGLTVRPALAYGAAGLFAMDGGKLDLVQADYVVPFVASERIGGVKVVGGLHRARPGDLSLVVKARSKIRTMADLKGKKIAVSHVTGLGTLSLTAVLKQEGLDIKDVIVVESPHASMGQGLASGKLAAAVQAEPHVTAGVRQGSVRVLRQLLTGEFEGLPTTGWIADADWNRDNPRTLAAFRRALAKAHRVIAGDLAQAVQVIPQYAKVSARDLDGLALGPYSAELDVKGLQRLADLARRYSVLRKSLNVRNIIG
jgi:NitT/TauT family transport system substrate-binding protein